MKLSICIIFLVLLLPVTAAAGGGKEEAESAAEGGKQGTILRIGTPNEVKSASVFSDYYLGIFAHISNPPLMQMEADGSLSGLTAERVTVSEDNRLWTFYIRDDLYWSDGTKLSPEDVRFSIEYTGTHNPNASWIGDTLEKSEIGPDNSVLLYFNKPYTGLDLEFATYNILPKHVYQDISDPMRYTNPGENLGFGPFYIEEIDLLAGRIRFARNPHWQGREANIDGFEIYMYKNSDVLSLSLENGEVDTFYQYASSYPYAAIDRLKESGDFSFTEHFNMGLVFMGFNLEAGIMQDPRMREALTYLIDYDEIIKLDTLGYGRTADRGFVPPSMEGFEEHESLKYEPERGLELLYDAGYRDNDDDGFIEDSDGRDLTLTILVRSEWSRAAELAADYLADAGIDSVVRSLEINSWAAEKDAFNYDLVITRSTPWGMLMHAGWGSGYFDSRRSGRGVLHTVDDPDFLALCDAVLATADPGERKELGKKIQRYYEKELPAVALYWNMIVTPASRKFSGWKPDPLYGIYNMETFLSLRRSAETPRD